MDRGTYAAASAGLLNSLKLEIINNNLANVNTPGYKGDLLVGKPQEFKDTLASLVADDPNAKGDHLRVEPVVHAKAYTDFSLGPIKHTGNPFDVALRNPNDFFAVQTPNGTQYTRAGNFRLNEEGVLVASDGMPILGDGGQISVTLPGAVISASGEIVAGDQVLGKLLVVNFANPQESLQKVGNTRFALKEGASNPTIKDIIEVEPQALEMSNVSAIKSIIQLISATRGFEAYTRAAKNIDELNMQAINRVGKKR